MSPRALATTLVGWLLLTVALCLVVRRAFALTPADAASSAPTIVASVWSEGQVVSRAILSGASVDPALEAASLAHPGSTLVHETIVGEGPVAALSDLTMALSFVPGRDGVAVTCDGRTAYLTPDELLSRQAYDHGVDVPSLQLSFGLDVRLVFALLSEKLELPVSELRSRARFRRIRVARSVPGAPPPHVVDARTLRDGEVLEAAVDAGRYLARSVDARGRFRYLVDAPTNRTLPGYDWPRHAGATYYLAQVANVTHDPDVGFAALRAAAFLRDEATLPCGAHRCIGEGDQVDVGSTALTVIAFVEIARAGLDPGYRSVIPELTAFLRSQQRSDGELMHVYDRRAEHPVDVQLLYYSGEAALALSRAHRLLGDPADLDVADRVVRHATTSGWSFFGSRYYWGEEHWTCQAVADLWDRRPNPRGLDFCLGWHAYGRKLQYGPGDTPFDGDGAYGVGPLVTPRLTPAGSRTEAAIATLEAATRAGAPKAELDALDDQARRALAMLIRHQFRPGPRHLFRDPGAVEGAMPATEVDWQLRIDYAQHAGAAMLRWVALHRATAVEPSANLP